MTGPSSAEVPAMIEVYYGEDATVDDIHIGEREFCLQLLEDAGFKCVGGAVGVGRHKDFTVGLLDSEARRDLLQVASSNGSGQFFTGPNPAIENGVGIWTAA